MVVGPEKVVMYRCNNCDHLSRDYDIHEGWYDCYCGGNMIGCFCPGEDILPNTHQNPSEFKCPLLGEGNEV